MESANGLRDDVEEEEEEEEEESLKASALILTRSFIPPFC